MAATKKQAAKKPAPDLKGATSNALAHIADWAEKAEWDVIFGISPTTRTTREETEVLAEAKKLAVNYVRMGAQPVAPPPPANVKMKKGA